MPFLIIRYCLLSLRQAQKTLSKLKPLRLSMLRRGARLDLEAFLL